MTPDYSGGRLAFEGNLQFAWDATSLDNFQRCPRRYQLSVLEGWEPKLTPAPLEFGRLLHIGREVFGRSQAAGMSREDALREGVRALYLASGGLDELMALHGKREVSRRSRWQLINTLVWWADEYGDDDPVSTIIMPDGRPAIELSFTLPLGMRTPSGGEYLLCGHLDRGVRFLGSNFAGEWKHTTSTLGPFYFNGYSPNPQISLYVGASRVLLPEGAAGALVDATQLLAKGVRFARHFVTRTHGQNDEAIHNFMRHIENAARYAEAGEWPMNESACHAMGGCQFRGICALDPSVRRRFLAAAFRQREELWDPLKAR